LSQIKDLKIEDILSVDESEMNNNGFHPYAYAPIRKRYYEAHPGHYTKRISMIGGFNKRPISAAI